MANWTQLKAAIASVIKINGNQEITGTVLQNTLNSIVNTIGENATFAGVATPSTNPGTPDGPVFYFATQTGTYVNFSNITLSNSGLFVLYKEGDAWKSLKAYELAQTTGPSATQVMSQKAVTDELNAINSHLMPLVNTDICGISNYLSIATGTQVGTYSDTDFGNLGASFTILLKITVSSVYQEGTDNVLISKGDYTTNGWALIFNRNKDYNFYLCVNGVYHAITDFDNTTTSISAPVEIAILSGKTTCIYLYGKKTVILSNAVTTVLSPITVGSANYRYSSYIHYLSFTYSERSTSSIRAEFEIIRSNFIRKNISATFVACPLSLTDYGYSKGEAFSLTYSKKNPTTRSYSFSSIPFGYTSGLILFDGIGSYFSSSASGYLVINYTKGSGAASINFVAKLDNIGDYDAIEIHNLALVYAAPAIVFFDDRGSVIQHIHSYSINKTAGFLYDGYVDCYTFRFPKGTKRVEFHARYEDTYFKLIRDDIKIVEAKAITAKARKIYERTPIILFDSAKLINGRYIRYDAQGDARWIPVTKNGNTLQIENDFLQCFDSYVSLNAVYKDADGNIGIIHVYKDSANAINILDPENCPDNIAAITTHVQASSGADMHLSKGASIALGNDLVDTTKDTLSYLVNGIAGYLKMYKSYYVGHTGLVYNNKTELLDPLSRSAFSVLGKAPIFDGNLAFSMWGVYSVTEASSYTSNTPGPIVSFKQIAAYKKGYYEIKVVTPAYSATMTSVTEVTTAKAICTIKNNGRIVDRFKVSNWRADRKCIFLDERNTSDYILNVNKTFDSVNSLTEALTKAKDMLTIDTILVFKENNIYKCMIYTGDNTSNLTNTLCWADFNWENVEISFEQEGEGQVKLYINSLLQVEETTRLRPYPINADSYVAWLGDSWAFASDADDNETTGYPPLLHYDMEEYESTGKPQPTINTHTCPLPRSIVDATGCKMDLWSKGTKTVSWAWQYHAWHIINTKKYTHIVIEFFSNDQGADIDNPAEVMALARVFQNNGIIPIIFGPTTAAKSDWYNAYRTLY